MQKNFNKLSGANNGPQQRSH